MNETIENSFIENKKGLNGFLNSSSNDPLVIFGDALESLSSLPSGIVDVAITSPPYWSLRDYGHPTELGKEDTAQEYIDNLMQVHSELKRVLKDSGVYFLNIGDKYVNKGLELIPDRVAIAMKDNGWAIRNKIIWNKTNPNPSPVKDRFTNTYEVIFMFVKNPDNYLSPEYYFNLDAVRVKTSSEEKHSDLPLTVENTDIDNVLEQIKQSEYNGKFSSEEKINIGASAGGRASVNGIGYSRQRKHIISRETKLSIINLLRDARAKKDISIGEVDNHFGTTHTAGHWFRTDRGGGSLPKPEQWNELKKILGLKQTRFDKIMTEEHYVLQTVRNNPKGKNPGDVWNMATACLKEKHFAPFPMGLPERCIKACCPPNGVVLDPFCGSGTTLKIAKNLGRKSIGLEINDAYIGIIKRVVDESLEYTYSL